jgi:tryptophanyl-tRNA synthetase
MSLRDGTKKMSKSDPSDLSRISLKDSADTIAQKIRKAKTDPEPLPSETKGLEGRPEADNLVGIYAALAATTREAVLKDFGGAQFSTFKPALAELAVTKLARRRPGDSQGAGEADRLVDPDGDNSARQADGESRAQDR